MVPRFSDISARKEFGDVPEARLRTVDGIFAHAVAEHFPLYDDLVEIKLELPLAPMGRVIEYDGDRGARRSRRGVRSRKDEVLASLPAHALHGLLPERETKRFGYV